MSPKKVQQRFVAYYRVSTERQARAAGVWKCMMTTLAPLADRKSFRPSRWLKSEPSSHF